MPKVRIDGEQIQDGAIERAHVSIVGAGKALIRRLVAGRNVTLSSTGDDSGTGDVTVNGDPSTYEFDDQGSDPAAPAAGITKLFGKAAGLFTRRNGEAAKRLLDEDDLAYLPGVLFAVKTAGETVTSSTTLQPDNHLTVDVVAGTYTVEMLLLYAGAQGGDLKFRLAGTAEASSDSGIVIALHSAATGANETRVIPVSLSSGDIFGVLTGSNAGLLLKGVVTFTTPGTYVLEWAQGSSHATGTLVAEGSYLKLMPTSGVPTNATARYETTIGDGTTTTFTITHNLGAREVDVIVYEAGDDYERVSGFIEKHATTNTVTLIFASPPATNQYRVVVRL